MELTKLTCDVCGAAASARGVPFTSHTLLLHKSKRHSPPPAAGAEPLRCENCGRTHNQRGQPFRTTADLKNHQRHAHAVGQAQPALTGGSESSKPPVPMLAGQVRFCPQCGCNISVVNSALDLMETVNV